MDYPLNYYDEQGHLRPSRGLLLCLLYLCRGYLIWILSLTYRADSSWLLTQLYPDHSDLWRTMLIGLGAVVMLVLILYRDAIWQRQWGGIFRLLRPLLLLNLLIDMGLHYSQGQAQHWQFNAYLAISMVLSFTAIIWVVSSNYLHLMLKDWRRP